MYSNLTRARNQSCQTRNVPELGFGNLIATEPTVMTEYGIGHSIRRTEDARLLIGKGCFTDDLDFGGQGFVHFLRSSHAHAKILRIDLEAARAASGIIGAYSGRDLVGLGPIFSDSELKAGVD